MIQSVMSNPNPERLSPRHRMAIRAITSGMAVTDAAQWIGLSRVRMSQVYRSPAGQAYAMYLEALADDYVARMLALGLTPQHIASAVGGGKHPEQCKPRRARRRALDTPSADAGEDDDATTRNAGEAPSGHEGGA